MQTENIIAVSILMALVLFIYIIRYIKAKKSGSIVEPLSIGGFLETYSDMIVQVLKDSVSILIIKMDDYESAEDYEQAIIEETIKSIESNYSILGIQLSHFGNGILDAELLGSIVYDIFNRNYKNIFSELGDAIIKSHTNLIDEQSLYETNENNSGSI